MFMLVLSILFLLSAVPRSANTRLAQIGPSSRMLSEVNPSIRGQGQVNNQILLSSLSPALDRNYSWESSVNEGDKTKYNTASTIVTGSFDIPKDESVNSSTMSKTLYQTSPAANNLPQGINQGTGFNGLDQVLSGGYSPPDVQIAVGPTQVTELVNDEGEIWTKQGISIATFSLNTFFNIGSDVLTDPKVLYDVSSGRWFASVMDETIDSVLVAVSTSSDAASLRNIYTLSAGNNCPDQPILGISDDKVVISVNDYNSMGCSNLASSLFDGAQYWVLSKSDMTSGSSVHYQPSTPDTTYFSIHPVKSLSSTSELYMVSAGSASQTKVTLFSISGTIPSASVTTLNLPVSTTTQPPNATQPSSSSPINTNDARVLDASWFQNKLWLSLNDGCNPTGDTQQRSCIRLIEIDTSSGSVLQDFDVGSVGKYFFYPALSIDSSGSLYVVFGYSSSNVYPSVAVTVQTASDPKNTVEAVTTIKSGIAAEAQGRYGDYFGASTDPSGQTAVWVAGEYIVPYSGYVGQTTEWSTFVQDIQLSTGNSVTFSQNGLPVGEQWSVDFNSQTYYSTTNTLTINNLLSGSYQWSVAVNIAGAAGIRYTTNQNSGTMNVPSQLSQSIPYTTQYQVSFIVNPSGAGSVNPGGTTWYNSGTFVDIIASPNSNYFFTSWTGSQTISITDAKSSSTIASINGPGSVTANFASISISLSSRSDVITQGSSFTIDATIVGAGQPATLIVSGLPNFATAAWSTNPVTTTLSGAKVSLIIGTNYSTPAGSYPLAVTASFGSGESASAQIILTVRQAIPLTLSYSVSGGGTGYSPPIFSFVYNNAASNDSLMTNPVMIYTDQNSPWSVVGSLSGSSSLERWQTGQLTTGHSASSATINFTYYHQLLITFNFSVTNGLSGYSAPKVTYDQFGAQLSTPTGQGVWVDAGTKYSYDNPLKGSSQTERWESNSSASVVASSSTVSILFYHQFPINSSFSIINGGSPPSPILTLVEYGATRSINLTMHPTTYWIDAQANYSVSHLLASAPFERWITNSTSTGLASSQVSLNLIYNHQYYFGIESNTPSGGSVTPTSGWVNADDSISIANSANDGWKMQYWNGTGTGSYSGNANTTTIKIQSPINETAIFFPGLTISTAGGGSVTYSYESPGGNVQGSSRTIYVPIGTSVLLTSEPDSFLSKLDYWTGPTSGNTSQTSVKVSSPTMIGAQFGYNFLSIGGIIAAIAGSASAGAVLVRRGRHAST
jgi:Divergent InlB B-repeat domain